MPPTTRALTGPTAAIMLTVLANLYAILIAFVIVQGWSNLGEAQSQVSREATALSELFEHSHALPPYAALALVVSFDHPFGGGVHVTKQPIFEVLSSQ